MDIELRLLRSFVAIYEHGSLSRAAAELACTQAAMSMRLKMLESEIGERLFLRQHHRLEPTPKGTELYAKALGVLAAYDEMISTARSGRPHYKVRIGVPDDYALGILPRVFRGLRQNADDIEVEIVCDLSANLAASFHRRNIDIALVTLAARPSSARLMFEVQLNWVHHPDFLVGRDDPVALAAYPEGCVFRRSMISALDAAHRPWRVLAQSRSHAGIVSAVRAGTAVTAMAGGMAPSGLVETPSTPRLPELAPVPIYLVSLGEDANPAARRTEVIVREELERACVLA